MWGRKSSEKQEEKFGGKNVHLGKECENDARDLSLIFRICRSS